MCGILGTIYDHEVSAGALDLRPLRHRGPDAQRSQTVSTAALGHTRLSIIDLFSGAQPMSDVAGHATIVFNGEIYNHLTLRRELEGAGQRFATHSDTEVILAAYLAWGVRGFARLRGMYAFALYDHRTRDTVLARDPFGIKPLFWTRGARHLHFASELGALLSLTDRAPELDLTSVLETLAHRYAFGAHTLYQGVHRLEPGMAMIAGDRLTTVRSVQFIHLSDEVERHRQAGAHATPDDVELRVADSVAHHTIADVPVGCFLSGGLDSSVVAQRLALECAGPLQAYSVGFQDAQSEVSELPHARAVAASIGAELHEVQVGPADFADLAPVLSGSRNGPFADPADVAMLKLSLAAAGDVKVVLSGEGGDEAFAGYPKYAADRYAGLLGPAMKVASARLGRRGRLGIAADALSEPRRAVRWMRWFENDAAPQGLVSALLAGGAQPRRALGWVEDRLAHYPSGWSDLQRMQVLDLESWLPNNLLHRGDYTTMQASIEQRVPMLDLALTPWAVALPDREKLSGLRGKMPVRRAFARRLPQQVLDRPKSGFRLPLGEWLRSDPHLRAMAHDHLLTPGAQLRGWLSGAELERLLSPQALGTTGGAKLAWTALCLELWLGAARPQPVTA
ncbi:asparagine synthase (glutamine-hydrolyzing) (plasmid) [Deinococcus taeanensis]|uniref:asparagine synthase (glutamine-hydrolyzing) n=1 Tax=Deinococcus taeanensis TaxID=2737050 RepID=UPI001CDCD65E|nr:asparagine synthase (glutamine-hydrolyzing) [Deinococcus taeanensis]UBV44324.1 asparagine synthase (glutamine-hydrolyzing) [Deinococcus taeanensis]